MYALIRIDTRIVVIEAEDRHELKEVVELFFGCKDYVVVGVFEYIPINIDGRGYYFE